jgi:hypothetical protein
MGIDVVPRTTMRSTVTLSRVGTGTDPNILAKLLDFRSPRYG